MSVAGRARVPAWIVVATGGLLACGSAAPPARVVGTDDVPRGGPVRVFLPPGYPDAAPYPTLYFLHDFHGTDGVLWRRGVIEELRRSMESGELDPFVLVAPEGEHGFWSDRFGGGPRWESFVSGPLIDWVERRYAVRRDVRGRGVTGISMGGFGALQLALRPARRFGAASSLSGALIPLDRASVASYSWWDRRRIFRAFGGTLDDNDLASHDLRRGVAEADLEGLRVLLRAGTEDHYRLDRAAAEFAELLSRRGATTELILEPGGHNWRYWRRVVPQVARWHAERFREGGER